MFTEVLLIIAPNWNQPRCLSTGEMIVTVSYMHTTRCYLEKKNLTHTQQYGESQKYQADQKKVDYEKVYTVLFSYMKSMNGPN